MKLLLFFIALIAVNSCSNSPVKIYHKSKRFIDIEVTKEHFWFECDEINHEEKRSFMTFYALEQDTVHQFIFRVLKDTKECHNLHAKYTKMIEYENKIRIVGVDLAEKSPNYLAKKKHIPTIFKTPKYLMSWFFVRFHTSNACEPYFSNGCSPEEYWGGLFPQK